MVDVQTPARSAQDTGQFRGFPTQPTAQTAAAPAAPTSQVDSFIAGLTAAPVTPTSTISDVSHHQDRCGACVSGEEGHYSFAERRADPSMVGVIASRLVTGPNQ
jgi:hypothetical protein